MDPFVAAICTEPNDDLPRLIYADWLDERGDPRGEFIRLQLSQHAGEVVDTARIAELEKLYCRKWAGPFADWAYMVGFRRGFPEHVVIQAEVFIDFADEVFKIAPIQGVSLIGAARYLRKLVAQPALQHLKSLHLTGTRIGDRGVRRLAGCPHLQSLHTLRLGHCDLTANAMTSICESGILQNLKQLDMSDNEINGDAIHALANSCLPKQLERLDLRNNQLTPIEIAKLRQLLPARCLLLADTRTSAQ